MNAKTAQRGATLTNALEYIELGFAPIPIKLGQKGPKLREWETLTLTAKTAPEHFNGTPQNIGIRLGAASGGLVDIDLDCPEARVAAAYLLPQTGCMFGRQGSRRSHYLYNVGGDAEFRKLKDPEVKGNNGTLCEIRGDGGHQTVFPPSVHKGSGELIDWDSFEGEPPRVAEADLVLHVLRVAASALLAKRWPGPESESRHDAALALTGVLMRGGMSADDVVLFIRATAEAAGDDEVHERVRIPEYTATRLETGGKVKGFPEFVKFFGRVVVDQVVEWLGLTPAPPVDTATGDAGETDTANAERFANQYSNRVRFCENMGGWLVWDGRRWAKDETREVWQFAKAMGKQMLHDAMELVGKPRERATRWARASQMETGIRRCLTLAKSEPPIAVRADAFDAHPHLLNCENGTVDLRTGELQAHAPGDLLTKLAPVVYDPKAQAPIFRAFLTRIFRQHPDVAGYVQRAIGYAAFGVTSEQCLFVMHGSGANGKSTLMDAVSLAMGDYAGKAEPNLLIAARDGSHPTGVADLCGLRLAVCSETTQGREFDEQRLKDLTGEQRLKARYMRRDFFEFPVTHTLFLATNHRPQVRGTDHAVWRRMKLIPFVEIIGDDERDLSLPDKLRDELQGILAWIIRGAVEWHRNGLNDPDEVTAAVAAYRAAEDVLGRWIDEHCLTALGKDALSERAQRLYDAHKRACIDAGEHPIPHRRFGEELNRRGFVRKRTKHGFRWYGIMLRTGEDEELEYDHDHQAP